MVSARLTPELTELFFAQNHADQRHGHHAALSVIASGVDDGEVVIAALMHDIGKRHARLGIVGRSLASAFIVLGLPLTERMTAYRDHGLIGARELESVSAPPLAIDFAIHHHRERPESIDPGTWETLIAADQPPKASSKLVRGITSTAT
ncbi:MAG: HD domain-containing protein [Acidimicrobiia bacterium]